MPAWSRREIAETMSQMPISGCALSLGRGRKLTLARRLLDLAGKERLPCDHQPLDLRGPLVELHDLRVAHQLLDRVLLDEAVPAVDLDRVNRDLHGRVRGEALGV